MFPWNLVRIDVRGSTCSGLDHKQIGEKFFPYPSAWPVWAFLWPVVGGDTFSPPAPILGPVKTNDHANNCSSGRIWYEMCNIWIDGASGIWEGANFRRLVSTKDWNTSNRTDLPLRPKATKLEIRLRTLEKRQELYRPHLVPLPFPLLSLCLKVVPLRCCYLLVALRERHLASDMYVMKSMKKLKQKWSSSSTTKFIPG